MAMAVVGVGVQQHLLCSSESKWSFRTTPCNPLYSFILIRPHKKIQFSLISCSSSSSSSSPRSAEADTQTAESCVNLGLQLFSKGKVKDALAQFETALTLNPNPLEAQAAFYNKACCHAYRGEGKKAADSLRTALREYNLKFGTILNDPDLASFRALPEFKELQEEARLGGEDIGNSFRRDLKLISEVQAPFRGEEEQMAQISRDETLSRLPLRLTTNRVVELVQLRDTVRPVILAGKKETVSLALQRAERFRTELVRRGVLLVPVIWGEGKETKTKTKIEKKGFGGPQKAAEALPSIGEDFDKRTQSIASKSKLKAEIRFKAEVVSQAEWEQWIRDQQKSEGVTVGEDVYIIMRLDGRIRRSGKGMPDWQQIVKELPEMEAFLSKLER
ncbi:Protein LOW PSII ACCUMULATION 1, chloroplastic [Stylosanthes scabra]|uniref:Protein LOW PSII ACCUMULATION 1, chloroplastic n=1 Tax=Stylosanthes scabra TaxID=79078 RepID=A0ABU6SII2_9FABA|nr:Protein LOW PSII ACCUMULATION 1, chloroplastic [Stylosanthes scabra]